VKNRTKQGQKNPSLVRGAVKLEEYQLIVKKFLL